MDKTETITELIRPVLDAMAIELYEVKWLGSGKNRTLEISIMRPDGTMDLDTCALVSEKISELLDSDADLTDAYMLEVCSPGAEREVKDINSLRQMNDPYVYIRLEHPIEKKQEYTGEVTSMSEDSLVLSYRDKTRNKAVTIAFENIQFIRFAVRI